MASKKRASLETIFGPEGTPPEETASSVKAKPIAAGSAAETGKGRIVRLSLYLPEPVYEQLSELRHADRKKRPKPKLHDLVLEGLDLLFASRGQKSIADLTGGRKGSTAGGK